MGRSFSPVPERGGITGRLERVEKDEEATRLREQLLKKQMERSGAKSTGPPPAFEPSRKKGKSGEPHAVMSVAAMELNEDIVEGPSRPSRTEKHHKHERHEEKRGRSRDYDDGEHERKKHERRSHGGKKRRHE
ncbi:hypothetical protein KFL_001570130 [Klebsormidium nitens]|uniref:Uncharacterized protein n=1 Tax=Klebsormidium nitens TaxID=105231 RepID=A0A0U9HLN7_KLENI|nr:hypothetical protein KFL_001570130 [Klebsormidium nitens]|eukprot:GAQ83674.1 hypothetical protein KFL_001570130 [Klebsormidium nitens]